MRLASRPYESIAHLQTNSVFRCFPVIASDDDHWSGLWGFQSYCLDVVVVVVFFLNYYYYYFNLFIIFFLQKF